MIPWALAFLIEPGVRERGLASLDCTWEAYMNARTRVRLITVAVSLVLTLGVLGILRVVAVEAAQTAPLAHTAGVRLGAGQAISVTRVSPATLSHLTTPTASPAGWTTECADCPKYFETLTDRSVRRDSAGYPASAYGGDHLYYAHHDGSVW